jgi:hypothetical protein
MDNSIEPDNIDDLQNEKAAVAMLLAAAAQAMEDAAPTPAPEPVEDIDFNGLVEKRKVLQNQLATLQSEETKLLHQVRLVREQSAEVERQIEFIAAKAKALFESTFERPAPRQEQQPPQPQPTPVAGSAAPPRKLDNSIVSDRSVPTIAMPQGAPAEAHQASRIPSLQL